MTTQNTNKPVVLRIYQGDRLIGVKQFSGGQIVIGRPGDVQVPLEGEAVSLLHASIEERNGSYIVSDLGSLTGTYKNGAQVLEEKLVSGDVLQIAEYRIEFFIGAPAAASVKPSEPTAPVKPPKQTAPPPLTPRSTPPPVAPPQKTVASAPSVASVAAGAPAQNISRSRPTAAPRRSPAVSSKKKTFAPPSKYADVRDFVKPSKGTVIEVLVAWRERVIASHHFSGKGTVTIGSRPENDIVLPLISSKIRRLPLLKIDNQATVLISQEMRGEVTRGHSSATFMDLMRQNRLGKVGALSSLVLEQGEMARVEIAEGLSVIIRYVAESPKPLVAPLLDLTATETTGVVLALALVATLYLYVYLYQPMKALHDEDLNEPLRTALIVLTPPTPPPLPEPIAKTPKVEEPVATPPPQKIQVADRKRESGKKEETSTNLTTKNDPGASAAAAPNKNKTGPRKQTSVKQGGAIKTAKQESAQMQSKSRDVTKAGVFSVFGSGGAQDQLAQSTTGSGELAGMAGAATGRAGSAENRAGQGLGSELKDTGMGGTGKSLEGIAGGVGTRGRGSGQSGYGTGGLGNRQGVKIVTGGSGEDFRGTIDKDGIRRVIQANLRSIRACYERQLNRQPDLFGKLVLTWVIGEQGRVVSAGVKSNELGSSEVADCILERLKTWRFPDPPANTLAEVAAYPFLFSN